MRVKIGNQWHDSTEEPICIQMSRGEQQQIAEMDRSVAPEGRFAIFPESWSDDRVAMRRWMLEDAADIAMDNHMRPPLRTPPPESELSELAQVEARIVQAIEKVLGITADQLEPPILKDHGDVEHARQMDRRILEEKYALALMAGRLATFHLKRAQAAEPDAIKARWQAEALERLAREEMPEAVWFSHHGHANGQWEQRPAYGHRAAPFIEVERLTDAAAEYRRQAEQAGGAKEGGA